MKEIERKLIKIIFEESTTDYHRHVELYRDENGKETNVIPKEIVHNLIDNLIIEITDDIEELLK